MLSIIFIHISVLLKLTSVEQMEEYHHEGGRRCDHPQLFGDVRKLRPWQTFASKYKHLCWLDTNRNKRFTKTRKRFEGQVKVCKNQFEVLNQYGGYGSKAFIKGFFVFMWENEPKKHKVNVVVKWEWNVFCGVKTPDILLLIGWVWLCWMLGEHRRPQCSAQTVSLTKKR